MSGGSGLEEPGRSNVEEYREGPSEQEDAAPSSALGGSGESRLIRLMEEFRERQRESPELVVRPWWSPEAGAGAGRRAGRGAVGFVVEYCPRGVESAEVAVRRNRVRVEGPGGVREAMLDLGSGWLLDGADVRCPELLVNHLLGMADRLLIEAA